MTAFSVCLRPDGGLSNELLEWSSPGEAFEAALIPDCGRWCRGTHLVVVVMDDQYRLVISVLPARRLTVRTSAPSGLPLDLSSAGGNHAHGAPNGAVGATQPKEEQDV